MPYTTSPYAPRARRDAVNFVRQRGWSNAQAARYVGVHRSTIGRWLARAPHHQQKLIPTLSSRPRNPAGCLDPAIVERIVAIRQQHRRCAPVIYIQLQREGIRVSLSSVERTLRRKQLLRPPRYSPVKPGLRRPPALSPGALVQVDTIHISLPGRKRRHYIYTLIDLASRWAYAEFTETISARRSAAFVLRAQAQAPFAFQMVQSDNGSEFSKAFRYDLAQAGLSWRHTRVRQSNDNAHIERFNRTLQEEGFGYQSPLPKTAQRGIDDYLKYYNTERLHMGINYHTPLEQVAKLLT